MSNCKTLGARRKRELYIGTVVFLFPIFLLLTIYLFYPIVQTFITSTYKWNGISPDKDFVGIQNWVKLLKDDKFLAAFKNNITIMLFSVVIQIPMGVILATFMEFANRKLTKTLKLLWFIPMLMSSIAVGFLFRYALATNGGIVSTISQFFGGPQIDLLGNVDYVLYTVIGIIAWQFIPFYMVYMMAAYTNIPVEVYESAVIDGANKVQYFKNVALPLLFPAIRNAIILSLVGSLKYFDLVFSLTGGGPSGATELMATYMYELSFSEFNMGYGSAVAAAMFVLISLIAFAMMKILDRLERGSWCRE